LARVSAATTRELATTKRNLRLLREVRLARGEHAAGVKGLEEALHNKCNEMEGQQTTA
jgi:hypothetical protein